MHYVYIGDRLPYYGAAALQLARKFSGMDLVMIGNSVMRNDVQKVGIEFVALEDFYDPQMAEQAASNITQPVAFRDGFWRKTLERFFVLEQFMRLEGTGEVWHAELDQLLFRVDLLAEHLSELAHPGVFMPFHGREAVVASVFYCNDMAALASMLEFVSGDRPFKSEMQAMANWAKAEPDRAQALPTLAYAMKGVPETSPLQGPSAGQLGGVVDAAQLGQWIAGIDPRNLPLSWRHTNKYVDHYQPQLLTGTQLASLSFAFKAEDGSLDCCTPLCGSLRVYNLHLHSKIHREILKGRPALEDLLRMLTSQGKSRIRGTRMRRLQYFATDRLGPALANPKAVARSLHRRAVSPR